MRHREAVKERATKGPTKPRRPRSAVPVKNPALDVALKEAWAKQSKRNEEK